MSDAATKLAGKLNAEKLARVAQVLSRLAAIAAQASNACRAAAQLKSATLGQAVDGLIGEAHAELESAKAALKE